MVDRPARLACARDGRIACALRWLAHELARRGCASAALASRVSRLAAGV
jgi:hypothetical protein